MMTSGPLFVAVCVALLALVAGTLRSIKQNLIHRPADQVSRVTIAIFDGVEGLLWAGCLLSLIAAAPHPVTLVLVALFVVSIVAARELRYREEKRSINRWLRMATNTNVSVSDLLDNVANGCRSSLAWRAKACVNRLNRGESIADAARRVKLPLDADTLASILVPKPGQGSSAESSSLVRVIDSDAQIRRDHESSTATSLAFQQFTYVIATMFLAWLIGMLIRSVTIPTVDDFSSEFTVSESLSREALDSIVLIGHVSMIFFLGWLLFAVLLRWLPLWMVRCVPWFGARAIDQWRCSVLATLERGMRSGQADSQILQCSIGISRVRWIRARCRAAKRFVESGTPLPVAMYCGKLVSAREQRWLTCAENNAALPDAMMHLSRDIQRRQTHRWKIRMAWIVPLATVLVGGFVLAHAMFLFHFLFAMIGEVS